MTELSPDAREIDRAIAARIQLLGEIAPSRQVAAAALRAAADQVVPQCNQPSYADDFAHGAWFARDDVRDDLLRIANELETHG